MRVQNIGKNEAAQLIKLRLMKMRLYLKIIRETIVAIHEALENLGKLDERKVRVVEMKFFGGLTMEEIAEVLKISPETVKRDWGFSRTWLLRELANAES